LQSDRFLGLSGISGSGKSETAAALAQVLADKFDLVIWLPAANISSINDLKGVDVERRGRKMNMHHLLHDRSCLVILDDLRASISKDALLGLCGPNSAVFITRQASYAGDLAMPPLDRSDARRVLEHDIETPCPDDIFNVVQGAVGGHPLALKLLNAGVRNGDWEDLRMDCSAIGDFTDEVRTQRLSDRLLGRLKPVLEKELAFFAWCDSARVDRALARHTLLPLGVRKIEDFCLLATDRPDVLRVHDVVKTTISAINLPLGTFASDFNRSLDAYIEGLASQTSNDLSFLSLCQIHREQLERLLKEDSNRYGCLYCLLHSWGDDELDVAIVGDPSARAADIVSSLNPSDVDVVTVLEMIEAIYRKFKRDKGLDGARASLQSHLEVFDPVLFTIRCGFVAGVFPCGGRAAGSWASRTAP